MTLNGELDLDKSLIRSRSGTTMASYRPSLLDCFQADGSGDEISDKDSDRDGQRERKKPKGEDIRRLLPEENAIFS